MMLIGFAVQDNSRKHHRPQSIRLISRYKYNTAGTVVDSRYYPYRPALARVGFTDSDWSQKRIAPLRANFNKPPLGISLEVST